MSAADESDMERLADQIADGKRLALAAIRINISFHRAQWLWARICNRLGETVDERG